jgi:hypothetical protein
MSNSTGTIEAFAIRVSQMLQPLVYELKPHRAGNFLQEIGINVSEAQVLNISTALGTITDAMDDLLIIINSLTAAVDEGNIEKIIAKGKEAVTAIKSVMTAVKSLKSSSDGVFDEIPSADELLKRVLYRLIVQYLEQVPGLVSMLQFLGVLEVIPQNVNSSDPNAVPYNKYDFDFGKIGGWLGDSSKQMRDMYGWGSSDINATLLFGRIENILVELGMPVIFDPSAADPIMELFVAEATINKNVAPNGLQFNLHLPIAKTTQEIKQGDWTSKVKLEADIPLSASLLLQPGGRVHIEPPIAGTSLQGDIAYTITGKKSGGAPFILLGIPGGTRIQLSEVIVQVKSRLEWNAVENKSSGKISFEASLKQCKIVLKADGADSFLQSLLPPLNLEVDFDLRLGWSSEGGFYIEGSSALEITLPVNKQVGPVSINGLSIGFKPKAGAFPLTIGANLKGTLGPITLAVQDVGAAATLSFIPNGNMGFAHMDIGFKPPKGVGISIDAKVVKGGGFLQFDPDKGEYVGALELSINNTIQVAAVGIINTKLPDGSKGFSLLIIISATFSPGIALGMGFFLGGLGGMLGIHRTINVPALLEGARNNSISNILFPQNIVASMPTLLPQIKTLFPIQKDQFFIGLMARITWGVPTLVKIDFGIALEFPSPVRLAILGVLKIALPSEDKAVLKLQVNFAGVIDFDNKYLAFDAALYDSRILTFALEGQMAVRLSWGQNKAFLMSAGGFHPSFSPPAELRLPSMKRITLTILPGNPRLVLTAYFAVTSNTVQFGARIDFRYKISKFSVVGFLLFDVLFQFSPFRFEARIAAGLAVKWGNSTILSISLDFTLTGPTPWHARGTASFSILFISVKVRLNVTWGEAKKLIEESIPVLPRIIEAFSLPANWTVEAPVDRPALITLGKMKAADNGVILQPSGFLKVSQTIMPLGLEISRFGNATPGDIKSINIKSFKLAGNNVGIQVVKEVFAPSAFRKMNDADKLKAASFSQEAGGIRIQETDNALHVNYAYNRPAKFDIRISDFDATPSKQTFEVDQQSFKKMAKGGAIGQSPLSALYRQTKLKKNAASIAEEDYIIINNATMQPLTVNGFSRGSRAVAEDMLAAALKQQPALQGGFSIVPAYHLSEYQLN